MNKNFRCLALALGALFAASCSSDDSSSSYAEADLIKKWYPVSTVLGGQTFPYDDHEECGKDYLEFKAGGVARDVDVWECNEFVDELTWSKSGNKVTLSSGGQSTTATIIKLTESTLKVTYKGDWDEDGDVDTVIENYTSLP